MSHVSACDRPTERPGRPPRSRSGGALLVLALLGLGASAVAAQQRGSAFVGQDEPPSVLRPGDAVRVTVWRKPEYSGDFLVTADSTIAHPLYRQVKVVNVPLPEVRQRLQRFLSEYESNPELVIEPLFRVAVGGQVRQPNLYPLPAGTTIGQAIALAGGPTDAGRLSNVRLIRGGEEIRLDLTDPRAPAAAMTVRSGDQIFVDRRGNFFNGVLLPFMTLAGSVASLILVLDNR